MRCKNTSDLAESIKMSPIEEVYDGISRNACNGIEFVLCPARGNYDDENVTYYINGQGMAEKTFVLPAIKVGVMPNDDGFYPVSILHCGYSNGCFMINTFKECSDDEKIVFFDAKNKMLLDCYKDISRSFILGETQEHVVGSVTNDKYFYHLFWKFTTDF